MIKIVLLILGISLVSAPYANALSQDQFNVYNSGIYYFDVNAGGSNGCVVGTPVSATASQTAIIKTIIGVAKTDGLDQSAALIGLMTADAESGFKVLANSTVPVSLSIPNQGVGSNYDSVGVFQQRPSTGWSTLATGAAADYSRSAVAQLMDPAYSAEAFFGSPYGSSAPAALSKGLQDIPWKSMSPAEAASTVQGNEGGAATYAVFQSDAQSLINQYWSASPAVPLPVPLKGGGASAGGSTDGSCSGNTNLGSYNNPFRDVQQLRPERIDQGVDYAGEGSVYALGDGVITNLTNAGWNFGGYDAFIGEKLTDGPAQGLYVYMAEACVPVSSLHVGDAVNSDTVICNMINPSSTGIETGWALPPGNGAAMAQSVYHEGASTAFGDNYNKLLVSLGAPSGVLQSGGLSGSLPSGWPQW